MAMLIDADLRRPRVAKALGLPAHTGLSELLHERCSLTSALVRCEQNPKLYILSAGEHRNSITEILDSTVYRDLIETAGSYFDYIVVDAPPVNAVADYQLLQLR